MASPSNTPEKGRERGGETLQPPLSLAPWSCLLPPLVRPELEGAWEMLSLHLWQLRAVRTDPGANGGHWVHL